MIDRTLKNYVERDGLEPPTLRLWPTELPPQSNPAVETEWLSNDYCHTKQSFAADDRTGYLQAGKASGLPCFYQSIQISRIRQGLHSLMIMPLYTLYTQPDYCLIPAHPLQ